ncbi:MAG TPA: TIGR01459 family HAD-type hydrolase [Roseovarius sp.]|nr:TIGR01459 family HAD-type hydrolase [Roseovarius sp.]
MTQIIQSLSDISSRYDALFVDLWGCVHNGIKAFPDAVAALRAYRERGGAVVLVTNSPRPRAGVEKQLDLFEVPRDCWDSIATSGDSARAAMFRGVVGQKVYFIGAPHDTSFFEPIKVIEDPVDIEIVPLDEAEGIVCTGPVDPMADPATYRADFLYAKTKGLKLLCANPDIVVDRGDHREWCAGALARLYTEMGGESLYFGKPHPPIYDLARRRLAAEGHDVETAGILAIGDGIHTDISGAMGEDIDSLFISGGLAARETRTTRQPDESALESFLDKEKIHPTYTIGHLR